jgi:hypothetical protein
MKKITGIAGAAGAKLRDRSRSVKLRVLEIARAARSKRSASQAKLTEAYRKLLDATGRVLGQAKRFAKEIGDGVKPAPGPEQGLPAHILRQALLEGLRDKLETMVPRVQQVVRQTKARVFAGDTHAESLPSRKRGARSSACSSRQRRSFAKARPASRPNSAKWSSCRKPRTRSSSPMKSTISGPAIRIC